MQMVLAQLVITVLLSLLLFPFGWIAVLSGLLGGGIATLASALFAHKVFVHYRAQQPGMIAGRFYAAEAQKLLLVAILFALLFIYLKPLNLIALFGIYIVAQFVPALYIHFFSTDKSAG
jgi:ATP synthase protein I